MQSNYEAMNALKIGMEKSKFRGREDTDKLIEALEGLEMKEGDDFPQGDKTLRKEDHQAFLRQFITEVKGGKYKILEVDREGQDGLPAGLQVRLSAGRSVHCDMPPRPMAGEARRPLCSAPRA